MPAGRFAPSPTGPLHLGNLRTALAAWLFARSDGGRFVLRFDDLDGAAARPEHEPSHLEDLAAIGLDWDGEPQRQSERLDRYRPAIEQLVASDVLYPCWCSRREIRDAAQAPNRPLSGHGYPGTCSRLDSAQRGRRARSGRPPALRIRAEGVAVPFLDEVAGAQSFEVDDFVVQRNDGTPAYHLVTVVDDAEAGVELVVRADDLLDSTSRQLLLIQRLGLPRPRHAHVPLVLAPTGERLAKRHGAVTLADRARRGQGPAAVVGRLAASLGLWPDATPVAPSRLLERFDPALLPRQPLTLTDAELA